MKKVALNANLHYANKTLHISLDQVEKMDLKVYSTTGELMLSKTATASMLSVPVDYESGVYLVRLSTKMGVKTRMIIVR